LNARRAGATLAPDIDAMKAQSDCNITSGNGKIPFICFDLAGGANIAGSNVLVGKEGGQFDFLSTQGYSKLGIPGDMLPSNPTFVNTELGLAFHADSAMLRGILEMTSAETRAGINGCVIAARSENDTGNNPHNPMYGIAKAGPDYNGAKGELLTLIGTQNSESGGNSMAPAALIDPALRPTKIDRASDVIGLVDTGQLGTILGNADDTVRVLESMTRISRDKLERVSTRLPPQEDEVTRRRAKCAYVKTADTIDRFADRPLNPVQDPDIQSIFGTNLGNGGGELQRTAAVMKLVVEGNAGAGTITLGGYDYHTGDRATGERRDYLAGRCIGACLEFAARRQQPLMVYVFSDGSVSSNGRIDDSPDGGGKGEWTSDNQSTAASFFLVYNPLRLGGRPMLIGEGTSAAARHQQLGVFSANGDVVNSSSPAANNVNLLVQTVILNYMALHGEAGLYNNLFGSALGTGAALDGMIAFEPILPASANGKVPPLSG